MSDLGVWEIRIGDQAVEVRDLPLQDVAHIARVTDISWAVIVGMPFADLNVAELLLETAARYLGIDSPDKSTLTPRAIMDYFVDVSDRDGD